MHLPSPRGLRAVFVHSSPAGVEAAPPLGSGCIAASLLAAGLLDPSSMNFFDAGLCSQDAAAEILAFKPDLVGFSLYLWNSLEFENVARAVRQASPDIIIICGGPDAERLAEEDGDGIDSGSPFDAVFIGEAETDAAAWLAEYAEKRHRAAKTIRCRPPKAEDLASPWLSKTLELGEGSAIAWELARGCPFRCAYCYEGRGVSGLRVLPMRRIEEEIELFAQKGVERVFVLDPTFNAHKGRALQILRLIAKKGGNIRWDFEVRAELLDREQARAFSRLDCSLQIGLQSSNPKALASMRRSLDPRAFREKLSMLDEFGIVYGLDLIYGLPGDSLGGFRESLDFALSLSPNHLDIFPLALIPGTEFCARKAELGLKAPDKPPYTLLESSDFPPGDMAAAALLSDKARKFYTEGRAVPWFEAVLKPLRMKPSAFLDGLEPGKLPEGEDHEGIEAFQRSAIETAYLRSGKARLLAGALDLVSFYGAWSRAFAEGKSSILNLSYPPELVESPLMLDLETAVGGHAPRPRTYRMRAGKRGPRLEQVSAAALSPRASSVPRGS
ncbi:MAG TPA: B12-binding domain-containing radical SAM protein [Rectinemataceae bacterium]